MTEGRPASFAAGSFPSAGQKLSLPKIRKAAQLRISIRFGQGFVRKLLCGLCLVASLKLDFAWAAVGLARATAHTCLEKGWSR